MKLPRLPTLAIMVLALTGSLLSLKIPTIPMAVVVKDFRADASLAVSAKTGQGLEDLKNLLSSWMMEGKIYIERLYPYDKAGTISLIRGYGILLEEEYLPEGIRVKAYVPKDRSRIEGQVRGVKKMVEEDRYCIDILVQVQAIQAALNGFNKTLLSEHIHSCVVKDIQEGNVECVDELCETIKKLMK